MRAWLLLLALSLGLTYAYLYPGSQALLTGDTARVMSDDTDPADLPYTYDQTLRTWAEHPSRFLYGSVYIDGRDPERGLPLWMSFGERFSVITLGQFVPLEQLSTAVVALALLANAAAFFALTRTLGWSTWIGLALSLAWAFNPFTRARAQVHPAMAAIYHLPLIFLALTLIARGRDRRSLGLAALALLGAGCVNHYFLITTFFLSPLFLVFLFTNANGERTRVFKRLALAAVPLVVLLGFALSHPVPPDARVSMLEAVPRTGDAPDGHVHPFLTAFAADPRDFLTGDLALPPGPSDWNPAKNAFARAVLANTNFGNAHEHTNGIRWLLLALAVVALATAGQTSREDRRARWLYAGFGAFCFWLTLPPIAEAPELSPSYWLWSLVPQIRVPSRAGIGVHFAVLMLAGLWLAAPVTRAWLARVHKVLLLPGVLATAIVLEYVPFYPEMPLASMRPAWAELSRTQTSARSPAQAAIPGACRGLFFPFVNNEALSVLFYQNLQRLRGSDCMALNALTDPVMLERLTRLFPPDLGYLNQLDKNFAASAQLKQLARCVPLTFIAFDPHVPVAWSARLCDELGWQAAPEGLCLNRGPAAVTPRSVRECL